MPMIKLIEKIGLWFEIYFFGVYKVPSLSKAPTILDGGANAGVFSRYCKFVRPESKIIAVEPNPNTFEVLKTNLSKVSNVILLNKAITTECIVHISDGAFSWSNKIQESGGFEVEGISLLDLLNAYRFDHIKLDIEGCEYSTMQDAGERLLDCPNYSIELHEIPTRKNEIKKFAEFFTKNDYKVKFKFFLFFIPMSLIFIFPSSVVFSASKQ